MYFITNSSKNRLNTTRGGYGVSHDFIHLANVYCVKYLIVHDCSETHDAHMHVILLTHYPGVFDGFAVCCGTIPAIDNMKPDVKHLLTLLM